MQKAGRRYAEIIGFSPDCPILGIFFTQMGHRGLGCFSRFVLGLWRSYHAREKPFCHVHYPTERIYHTPYKQNEKISFVHNTTRPSGFSGSRFFLNGGVPLLFFIRRVGKTSLPPVSHVLFQSQRVRGIQQKKKAGCYACLLCGLFNLPLLFAQSQWLLYFLFHFQN